MARDAGPERGRGAGRLRLRHLSRSAAGDRVRPRPRPDRRGRSRGGEDRDLPAAAVGRRGRRSVGRPVRNRPVASPVGGAGAGLHSGARPRALSHLRLAEPAGPALGGAPQGGAGDPADRGAGGAGGGAAAQSSRGRHRLGRDRAGLSAAAPLPGRGRGLRARHPDPRRECAAPGGLWRGAGPAEQRHRAGGRAARLRDGAGQRQDPAQAAVLAGHGQGAGRPADRSRGGVARDAETWQRECALAQGRRAAAARGRGQARPGRRDAALQALASARKVFEGNGEALGQIDAFAKTLGL